MSIVKKSYWDGIYKNNGLYEPIDPGLKCLNNYVNRQFHSFFAKTFTALCLRNKNLIEIGCALSQWLPYFSKYFSLDVAGLDYSEIGCLKAKQIMERAGVKGEIINSDLFSPPETCLQKYSALVSFGVVEHFVEG